jgi:hypothetical protein
MSLNAALNAFGKIGAESAAFSVRSMDQRTGPFDGG